MGGEWKETTLGDEVDLLTGFPFKSEGYTDEENGIKLLRGDNVVQGAFRWTGVKRWPADDCDEYSRYQLASGDVVLAMDRPWIDAGLKYAAISKHDLPALLVQRTARLRGGSNLDTRFLRYIVGSASFTQHILAVQTGTAVPHISGQQIKEFRFALPPLSVQRAIADILGSLDDKIELNRRTNETLEAMARAVFKSWFVDFDPVVAKSKGRQPEGMDAETARLFPSSFQDSEIGRVPKGWRVVTLDSLWEFAVGGDWGSDSPSEINGSPAFCIRGADIPDLQAGGSGKMPRRYLKTPSLEKRRLQAGDLVVEVSGGSPTQSTGRPVLVLSELLERIEEPLVCSNFCRLVRLKNTDFSNLIFLWLRHLYGNDEFLQFENGTTGIKNLAFTEFSRSYPLAIPPDEILTPFNVITDALLTTRQWYGRQADSIRRTLDALLPPLLSGEITVPTARSV